VTGTGEQTHRGTVASAAPRRRPSAALPLSLDSTELPPVEALTPVGGLDFGSGFQVGPSLLFLDALGVGLAWTLTRRYLRDPDEAAI